MADNHGHNHHHDHAHHHTPYDDDHAEMMTTGTEGPNAHHHHHNHASPREDELQELDDHLLHHAVADAVRWSYGVIMVELWVLNENRNRLFLPQAGWAVDPLYHDTCGIGCQKCRLLNPAKGDYVPPDDVALGEGLPGLLWAESGYRMFGRNQPLTWRSVKSIADDPYQPWNDRLQLISVLDLGWASAIPFKKQDHEGIVIFLARGSALDSSANESRLRSPSNEKYLYAAADLIATSYAFGQPRKAVVQERHEHLRDTFRRVKKKLIALARASKKNQGNEWLKQHSSIGLNLDAQQETEQPQQQLDAELGKQPSRPSHIGGEHPTMMEASNDYCSNVSKGFHVFSNKLWGAQVRPPPPMSWHQTTWTFFGCLTTIMVIARVNQEIKKTCDDEECRFLMGSFGALMVLLFTLTPAPVAQPRNCILGILVSGAIGEGVGHAMIMEVWIRESVAVALATTVTAKLGIVHPIGSAIAITFAGESIGWKGLGFQILGYSIAISMAVLINNLSEQRQYPTNWGFIELRDYISSKKSKEPGEGKDIRRASMARPRSIATPRSSIVASPRSSISSPRPSMVTPTKPNVPNTNVSNSLESLEMTLRPELPSQESFTA